MKLIKSSWNSINFKHHIFYMLKIRESRIAFFKRWNLGIEDGFFSVCRLRFSKDADNGQFIPSLPWSTTGVTRKQKLFPLTNTGSREVIILETNVTSYPSCCSWLSYNDLACLIGKKMYYRYSVNNLRFDTVQQHTKRLIAFFFESRKNWITDALDQPPYSGRTWSRFKKTLPDLWVNQLELGVRVSVQYGPPPKEFLLRVQQKTFSVFIVHAQSTLHFYY